MVDGYTVAAIGDKAFYKDEKNKEIGISVTLPETVQSIGDFAYFRALIGVLVCFEIIERAHAIFGYLFVSGQKYFSITSYRMAGQHGNKDACRVQSENVTCKHFMNES